MTIKDPSKPKQKQLGKTKGDLKRRAKIIARAIVNGKTETEACKTAGYSDSYANSHKDEIVKNPKIQKTFNEILAAAGVTDEFLAERIRQLSTAKETKFFAHQGVVVETREVEALGVQADMVQFGTKVRGHLVDKVQLDLDPISAALEALETDKG